MEQKEFLLHDTGVREFVYETDALSGDLPFESTGDYILPDYQPEIRKILLLSSKVCPTGQYENGGRAECGGTLLHTLVYSDAEGKLATTSLRSDYDYSMMGGSDAAGGRLYSDEKLISVTCRLSGPRRLSIRARMSASPHILCDRSLACPISGEASETALLTKEASVISSRILKHEMALSGDASVSADDAAQVSLLLADMVPVFREKRVERDGVTLRGEVIGKLLLSTGDMLPETVTLRLPFEEKLYAEDLCSDAGIAATGAVLSEEISFSENAGGVSLFCDLSLALQAVVRENRSVSYVRDGYFTDAETESSSVDITPERHLATEGGHFSVSGETALSGTEAGDNASAMYVTGYAVPLRPSVSDGRVYLEGEIKVRTLLVGELDENGVPRFASVESNIPFRQSLMTEVGNDAHYDCVTTLHSLSAQVRDGRMTFSGELDYTLSAVEAFHISPITSLTAGEKRTKDTRGVITAVFPTKEESLWDIAKRFSVLPETLLAENGLEALKTDPDSADSLSGVQKIFVL